MNMKATYVGALERVVQAFRRRRCRRRRRSRSEDVAATLIDHCKSPSQL